MYPVDADDAAIGDREIHINSLIRTVHIAAIVPTVVRVVNMSAVHQHPIVMVVSAAQMRMQRTERRKYETHAEEQQ